MDRNLSTASAIAVLGASSGACLAQGLTQTGPTLPPTKTLTALIRDFKAAHQSGGHADFQSYSGSHATVGLLEESLDGMGKPVVQSIDGRMIDDDWRDSQGRPISPALYDPGRGDQEGSYKSGMSNMFSSEASFAQWYNDVPGVNASTSVDLVFHRVSGTDMYVFDSNSQEPWQSIGYGGFFPINDELLGNYQDGRNYHFTTELTATFTYDATSDQIFHFTGDDDVWVYIGGRLAVDLGGLHPKREQYLDLSRLNWLVDGEEYELKMFHAERRTSHSNFKIATNLALKRADLPAVTALFD